MGYMARNADKRVNPSGILAGARSIVMVGLNYYTGDHGQTGRVARYAWGTRDYHEVMAEKSERLSAVIAEIGGPGTHCLGYVDTGPMPRARPRAARGHWVYWQAHQSHQPATWQLGFPRPKY